MEMYKKYVEELHKGKSIYYDETGFAVYWIREIPELGREIYIEDIYVEAEHRRGRAAHKLADKVADIGRENNCTYMTGSVVPSAENATRSLAMMLSYNFKLLSSEQNIIWFIKELGVSNV